VIQVWSKDSLPDPVPITRTRLRRSSLVTGLQIRRGEAHEALQFPSMFALGLLTILFCTPLVAYWILLTPIRPIEFAYGLAVFCCMPTSLSANIALAGVCTSCAYNLCFASCAELTRVCKALLLN
jgi:predicted Na+-dependent transporter